MCIRVSKHSVLEYKRESLHLCPGLDTTTILRFSATKIAIIHNSHIFFLIFVKFAVLVEPQFSATNLANIHLVTNLTKIAILRNSHNICN